MVGWTSNSLILMAFAYSFLRSIFIGCPCYQLNYSHILLFFFLSFLLFLLLYISNSETPLNLLSISTNYYLDNGSFSLNSFFLFSFMIYAKLCLTDSYTLGFR